MRSGAQARHRRRPRPHRRRRAAMPADCSPCRSRRSQRAADGDDDVRRILELAEEYAAIELVVGQSAVALGRGDAVDRRRHRASQNALAAAGAAGAARRRAALDGERPAGASRVGEVDAASSVPSSTRLQPLSFCNTPSTPSAPRATRPGAPSTPTKGNPPCDPAPPRAQRHRLDDVRLARAARRRRAATGGDQRPRRRRSSTGTDAAQSPARSGAASTPAGR